MFLKQSISNGKIYLSFVQGYRADGKVKQKTIEKIGYLQDLQKIYADPVAHFKAVAKERNNTAMPRSIEISLTHRMEGTTSARKNLGYAIIKRIYSLLEIPQFLQNKQKHLPVAYNLNSIFSLLVFNRFLFPSSKKKAFDQRDVFFESRTFSLDDLYRSLDLFSQYALPLQQHLHQKVRECIGCNNTIGYYDVTNYYFEIPYNDEDTYDDHGNLVKKGLRKKGPSKEHRPDPIVQMGLLMDANGIPMAFQIFSGGESEKTSLRPLLRRVKHDYGMERIITVADRGLNTSDNIALLAGINNDDSQGHDGYVYGQSILSADKEFKDWVLNHDGYLHTRETDKNGETVIFTHKSRIYAKSVQLADRRGNRRLKLNIYQKQMVYYSSKYAQKQKKERELVLAKARDLIANPGKYTRATCVGAAGYINNIRFVKETGEITNGTQLSLNLEKIAQEEQYDGYYAIVTSEKHLSDTAMRNIYKGLWEIEESFRVIKSEFKARPIYLTREAHIHAHFLICFVSLLILRILEYQLHKQYPVTQIRDSLLRYGCSYLDQNYYVFDYRDEILQRMESLLDMDLSHKIMSISEIKKLLQYSP